MTTRLFQLFNTDGTSTSPLGMAMNQNRLAVPTWSYAMELLPPARIVEFGTWNGGFTCALALHARMIGASVITYDTALPDERIAPVARSLGVEFVTGDMWPRKSEIERSIASPGVTFVLCDGGNKLRELDEFAASCKPGDVIAAHDYDAAHEIDPGIPSLDRWWPWSEVTQQQVRPIADRHGLRPWLQEHFDMAGWIVLRK